MPLNLITDPWIPVVMTDGSQRRIAPWQICDDTVLRLNWPRADLNIACLELLVGLVFLADPPRDVEDWDAGRTAERLRERLALFAPAFELMGNGPRFMQDLEPLTGAANTPDMLFIDSAGGNAIKNNADLMVWRNRYSRLEPALAAMALYTLQTFAPSGGAGNRTSMRGGGPLVTLVRPPGHLWAMIWANVPDGQAAEPGVLPWMRRTVTSEKGQEVFQEQAHPAEAFFGMPRRLRLVEDEGCITGVIQKNYGTNYAGWEHPLTPYYRLKLADEWLPRHPRAGRFGYRHWLGIVVAAQDDAAGLTRRARVLRDWFERGEGRGTRVLVAGWAMDNMKARDFILSTPPLLQLDAEGQASVRGLIEAAEQISLALRAALAPVMAEGEAREAVREAFYTRTEEAFEERLMELQAGGKATEIAQAWLAAMRTVAMDLFETRALPGLGDRPVRDQQAIVQAHRHLRGSFAGAGSYGGRAYDAMGLPRPVKPKKEERA